MLVTVKEWLKSVRNYRSYSKTKTGYPFFGPPCIPLLLGLRMKMFLKHVASFRQKVFSADITASSWPPKPSRVRVVTLTQTVFRVFVTVLVSVKLHLETNGRTKGPSVRPSLRWSFTLICYT